MKVRSDIAETVDEGSMPTLIMDNLLVSFDIMDHPKLLKGLEKNFNPSKTYSNPRF